MGQAKRRSAEICRIATAAPRVDHCDSRSGTRGSALFDRGPHGLPGEKAVTSIDMHRRNCESMKDAKLGRDGAYYVKAATTYGPTYFHPKCREPR